MQKQQPCNLGRAGYENLKDLSIYGTAYDGANQAEVLAKALVIASKLEDSTADWPHQPLCLIGLPCECQS